MKIVKTASGKKELVLSKSDWESIGKKGGWLKQAMPALVPRWIEKKNPKDWEFNLRKATHGFVDIVFAPKERYGDGEDRPRIYLSNTERLMLVGVVKKAISSLEGEIASYDLPENQRSVRFEVFFSLAYKGMKKGNPTKNDEEAWRKQNGDIILPVLKKNLIAAGISFDETIPAYYE